MTVVTLGEPLICLDSGGRRLDETAQLDVSVAGAECNVAVGLARLGHHVAYVGCVGADPFGWTIRRTLRGEGVDVTGLHTDPDGDTGLLFKQRLGDRTEVFYRRRDSAGSRLDVNHVDDDVVVEAKRVHVTGITPALGSAPRRAVLHVLEVARLAGVPVSVDANFRHKLAKPEEHVAIFDELVGFADDVLLSWDEASLLAGDDRPAAVADLARSLKRPAVVVKRRSGGAWCLDGDRVVETGAVAARVVDPVGSGDGFAVGFLDARLAGAPMEEALARGARVAARVVACVGDQAGLPRSDELDDESTGGTRR